MNRNTTRVVLSLGIVFVLVAAVTGRGHAQFVLYDDFEAGFIDPEKWSALSTEGNLGNPTAEATRAVDAGRLFLELVSWGGKASNSGSSLSRQGFNVTQLDTPGGSGSITGVMANVTVLSADAQSCAANTAAPAARAQLIGGFFNDGSSQSATDRTGDIIAIFQLQKNGDGSNQIIASVNKCTEPTCPSSTPIDTLAGNPATFSTPWSPNSPVGLKLVWNAVNGKFKFVVKGVETKAIVYQGLVTNAKAPIADFRSVRLLNVVPNCDGARKRTNMEAFFDQIKVQRTP